MIIPHYGNSPDRIVHIAGQKFRYAEFCQQCSRLQQEYDVLKFASIGQSVLGKPIWCVRIGKGSRHIHMNAAVHANEWITSVLLLHFLEDYAAALQGRPKDAGMSVRQAEAWYRDYTLWAVPMVNPDGVDLAQNGAVHCGAYQSRLLAWNEQSPDFSRWKANIRGVDLNDQFPAFWEEERERRGVAEPARQDYSGPEPLSEPEAAALAALTREVPFERVLSLHSQGKEIYWNYRDYEPEEAEQMAEQLAAAGHYRAVKLGGSDAGYKDWFIQEFRRPGFTIEVGEGINPLPASDFDDIYKDVSAILAGAMSF
ncbi:M14 family metallopeptidase [Paenibacillus pinistramenti]|uniref:M14 family metallopeptidase n=1 Tax=Paenibacillus pinistramenti TaxID=1768003 RepID=UPI0011090850|nr:M14 family metallocarboxypeptidase [Paenibacillus pinistramenti]